MTEQTQELLDRIFSLPTRERHALVAELMLRFDGPPDPGAEEAWAQEIKQRVASIRSGEAVGIPWEEIQAEIAREFKGA